MDLTILKKKQKLHQKLNHIKVEILNPKKRKLFNNEKNDSDIRQRIVVKSTKYLLHIWYDYRSTGN